DRLREGGIREFSMHENILMPQPPKMWRRRLARPLVASVIERFNVNPARPEELFTAFSGGNQQKAIVGRALALDPAVLVLAQPTAGVDRMTRVALHAIFGDAAADGIALLLISSDLDEIAALCTRVLFLHEGEVRHELSATEDDFSPHRLELALQ